MTDSNKSNRVRVTGLYVSETTKGIQYMSGKTLDGRRFSVWPNGFKEEGDNNPPYNLYVENVEDKQVSQTFDMKAEPKVGLTDDSI